MKRLSMLLLIFAVGLLAPLAATAGGPGGMNMGPSKAKTVNLVMGDIYFAPKMIKVMAGQNVKLVLINKGKLAHEFMLGKGGFKKEDGMIHGYKTDFLAGMTLHFEGAEGAEFSIEETGIEVELQPGARAELTIEKIPASKAGKWEYGCFQPGHYQAGQKGVFLVTK